MEKLGLLPDCKYDETIITADGKRHNTLGKISKVPISIADFKFDAELLVMDNRKSSLILGTDWLKYHEALIDIKNSELILPVGEYDDVLNLSTSRNIVQSELESFY
ncbi:hypothetical protein AYI70_g911 [Smittium culicis]|uniref:DNA damage-inducible protein 1 n=1 Tax=Smittium culicis TaxID=133412 RepID=A0A1R1YET4_9FUNG|nr:hypothetical protein AYI70_g911 [Smittium culicis]